MRANNAALPVLAWVPNAYLALSLDSPPGYENLERARDRPAICRPRALERNMTSFTSPQSLGSKLVEHPRPGLPQQLRPQQLRASRCIHQSKRRRTTKVEASAAGAASFGEDPYKVPQHLLDTKIRLPQA